MSKSAIEWTDETWNPVTGCDKISPGCKHCYAEVMAARCKAMGLAKYRNAFEITLHPEVLGEPLKWKKPRMCFVCSMSDLFHKDVPNEFIVVVFGVMAACPSTTFQVLTKRAERLPVFFEWLAVKARDDEYNDSFGWEETAVMEAAAMEYVPDLPATATGRRSPLDNVWIGVSVENRKHGLPRIEHLRRTPAAVRFLSMEPLIEDPGDDWSLDGIDWVIVGGESGHGARPMHPAWVRRIRDKVLAARVECKACAGAGWVRADGGVIWPGMRDLARKRCEACHGRGWTGPAMFFKQWGAWGQTAVDMRDGATRHRIFANKAQWVNKAPSWMARGDAVVGMSGKILRCGADFTDDEFPAAVVRNVGKGKAGRELDGRTWDEMPARVV